VGYPRRRLWLTPSLTSRASFARLGPRKGAGTERVQGEGIFFSSPCSGINPFETSHAWKIHALERQQDVGDLLAIARLLEVGDLAAAAIGDAGLRDL
jgi:hypothetical protein